MQNKQTTTAVWVVSGLLVGVAVFFMLRGIKLGRDAKKRTQQDDDLGVVSSGATRPQLSTPPLTQGGSDLGISVPKGSQFGPTLTGLVTGLGQLRFATTKANTNLRPEPSTEKKAIKQYPKAGVRLIIQGEASKPPYIWYKVTDGVDTGWVRNDAVNLS